ncbi:hypothetical protein [Candidatus Phytoplasma sacchari]|uniref:Sequence-variable mosaic (SVM) signal sequence domain-containing protein n=1 Tax=Candidatus Phytoplasma sacchari TaxID=2609813 RepID=A0ABY7M2U4_9MOLU|nr:hypothetical protein [Candidatus Phytoplasma sacchari]KAB8121923.1 hypothetical protein F2B49_01985 [Candidatus Phytoplasma sacchari]WBL31304.1 hypothetical protein O7R10_01700 [Candidatus Phytoplasma sacchari]
MNLKIKKINKINYLFLISTIFFILFFSKNSLLATEPKGKKVVETENFTENQFKNLEEIFNNLTDEQKELFLKSFENKDLYEIIKKKAENTSKYLTKEGSSSKKN